MTPAEQLQAEGRGRETILEEAQRITDGDRAAAYGSALPDARRFAAIASAVTGQVIRPEHFPLILLAVKLSRASQSPNCFHRDSIVDIAGYARVAEKVFNERCQEDDALDAQKRVRESAGLLQAEIDADLTHGRD